MAELIISCSAPRPKVTSLSQDSLKQLLTYDPDTGIFRWKFTDRNVVNGAIAGGLRPDPKNPYWIIQIFGKTTGAHRLAWLYMTGYFPEWPKHEIDHINHVKHDNRFKNLRLLKGNADQHKNRKKPVDNTSGCVGVHWHKIQNEWRAKICVKGKSIHLYSGDSWWDAVCARKSAEHRYGFHPNHGS